MSPSWYDVPLYDIEWVTMMTKGDDNIKNNKISSSTHPQLCCIHPLPRWYSEVLTSSPATMFWSTCHLSGSYKKSKSASISAQIKVSSLTIVVNFTLSKCISLVQQNWMASLYHKRPSWGLFPFMNLEIYLFWIKKEEMITTHLPIKTRKRVSSLFTSVPLGDGPKVAQSSEHLPSQSSVNPLTPSIHKYSISKPFNPFWKW